MLKFPLPEQGFFPQVVLTAKEIAYYENLGARQANELIRIAEDTKKPELWQARTAKNGATVQVARYQDIHQRPKHMHADENPIIIKSSVIVRDTSPHEVFHAVAKMQTNEYRRTMRYLHGDLFLDGMTLFKFPSARQGDWFHRAIKWTALKYNNVSLDFAFLEYAGKPLPSQNPNSTTIGYCMQEGIVWNREVPTLEAFKISRCCLPRTGVLISRTHCPSTVRVTSISLIDGEAESIARSLLAPVMQEYVGAIQQLPGLIERERVNRMPLLREWEMIPKTQGKYCAVCGRGFFLHNKYNCRACGNVVCSTCISMCVREERKKRIPVRICRVCLQTTSDYCAPRSRSSEASLSDHYDENGMWVAATDQVHTSPQCENGIQRSRPRQKELVNMLMKIAEEIQTIRDAIDAAAEEDGMPSYFQDNHQAFEDFFNTVCRIKDNVERAPAGNRPRNSVFPGDEEEKVSSVTKRALEMVRETQDASKAFLDSRRGDNRAMSVEAAGRGLEHAALNLSYMTATEPDEEQDVMNQLHAGSLAFTTDKLGDSIQTPPVGGEQSRYYPYSPPLAGLALDGSGNVADAPVAVPSINWAISLPSTSSTASHPSPDMVRDLSLSPPAVDTHTPPSSGHSGHSSIPDLDLQAHPPPPLTLTDLEEVHRDRDDKSMFSSYPPPGMVSTTSGFAFASYPRALESPSVMMHPGPSAPPFSFPSSSTTRSSLVGTRPPAPAPPVAKIVYMNELGVEEPYWVGDLKANPQGPSTAVI